MNSTKTNSLYTIYFQPFRVLWPSTLTLPLPSPSSCQVGPLPLGRAQLSQEEGEGRGRKRRGDGARQGGWRVTSPQTRKAKPKKKTELHYISIGFTKNSIQRQVHSKVCISTLQSSVANNYDSPPPLPLFLVSWALAPGQGPT